MLKDYQPTLLPIYALRPKSRFQSAKVHYFIDFLAAELNLALVYQTTVFLNLVRCADSHKTLALRQQAVPHHTTNIEIIKYFLLLLEQDMTRYGV